MMRCADAPESYQPLHFGQFHGLQLTRRPCSCDQFWSWKYMVENRLGFSLLSDLELASTGPNLPAPRAEAKS
jgi:hypothetical protein